MKNAEIKELTTKELSERVDAEKTLLVKLKLNHAISPLDNPKKITIARKNIARLNTEIVGRKNKEKQ